jgi:hypothetical protein
LEENKSRHRAQLEEWEEIFIKLLLYFVHNEMAHLRNLGKSDLMVALRLGCMKAGMSDNVFK